MDNDLKQALEAYILATPPKGQKTVLTPYMDAVAMLYRLNYSHQQISEFFREVKVIVSRETVGRFIRSNIEVLSTNLTESIEPSNSIENKSENCLPNIESENDEGELKMLRAEPTKKFQYNPILGSKK
ncbi:TPA: hypothetical protein MO340_004232 [Salmonella enterica subsp. salamae serovar 35:g,m,s,t:-]|nr:hypothetical protein [Salmonella enterica subsp. salamae serovar 35:g,m,s,t:-]HCA3549704.1 hypothetical protein [Salmonella enterica subsp. salamae serovar 35:g,m,s,t:-]